MLRNRSLNPFSERTPPPVYRTRSRSALLAAALATVASTSLLGATPAGAAAGPATPAAAQAAVVRLHIGEGEATRSCSGGLVNGEWVLTASSCFAENPQQAGDIPAGKPAWTTVASVGRSSLDGSGGHVSEVVELVPYSGRDLVLARLATPASTAIAPIALATAPADSGEVLQGIGFGRTRTEWVPGTAHTAQLKVGGVSTAEVNLVGATTDDGLCKGDSGAPLLRQLDGRTELVGIATRSRQGGCLGETETRTDAVATRTDDVGDWIADTMGRSWAQLMTATDFNGDGKADVLTVDSADKNLYTQPGDGKGTFGDRVKIGQGWSNMRLLAASDFTGDGKPDVLAANLNGNLYLYPGNGKNGITGSSVAGTGWNNIRLFSAGDFNGDKKGDLLAVHTDGTLYFYAGTGSGFASASVAGTGWANMRMISTGDFNADGKADIVGVHNNGSLYLYTGRGDGTVKSVGKTSDGWTNMRLLSGTDFNADGKADLIAIHTNGNIYAYPGNGTGGFRTPVITASKSQ
ncbi:MULTISPECIES: FG-GAP-like repeat-containing protein [unclassified Streptomyces]|uniref:FG-GAP-like repeat-containing protein n=1 Tax=unclassified Streptomyces TaxID=2593676 RepID=UPI0036884F37